MQDPDRPDVPALRTSDSPGFVVIRTDRLTLREKHDLIEQHNPAGWPRSRLPHMGGGSYPLPWVMGVVSIEGVPYGDFLTGDSDRDQATGQGACQVCGEQCGETLYAPATSKQLTQQTLHINGHPLCSERCVRLTLRACPHYGGDAGAKVVTFIATDTSYDNFSTLIMSWKVLANG